MIPGLVPVMLLQGGGGGPPAGISVRASATGQVLSASTYAVPLPAGIVAGDQLIIFVHVSSASARTITAPDGWTEVFNIVGPGDVRRFACYRRTATGSEGATVSVSINANARFATVAYAVRDAQAAVEATTATGSGTNPDPPALFPTWGTAANLWITVAASPSATATVTPPTGYDDTLSISTGNTVPAHIAAATRVVSSVSANPSAWTVVSNANWAAATVAVRPA